jgi:hypothetical protein
VSYYQDKISKCANDQKALFGIVKGLISPPATQAANTPQELQGESFNQFFLGKVDKIHGILRAQATTGREADQARCSSTFQDFTILAAEEASQIIAKSPSKSSTLDPWPTWMLKTHLAALAPTMSAIINQSLSSGIFPSEWKSALVTPLLKKSSLDPSVPNNYRPVSNLPFISKVTERVVAKQLTNYLQQNSLYPKFQSAYRANHSVETALLRVHNDILHAIDNQQGVILVLLDLSAAFDTISHNILLHRLEHRFGISGNVLSWITSYLTDRFQSVVYKGKTSASLLVPHGVPQGSVLGPILFSLYTSPICDIVSQHNIQPMLYADDTQLYLAFHFKSNPSIHAAMNSVEHCIAEVSEWMADNKLKLNGDKTEMMILTAPRLQSRVELSAIQIGDCSIPSSPSMRNLGSWFDQAATMESHVKFVCKTCYYHLHNIAAVRNMLTREATEKLMHAFITSRLDNCNSLLTNIPASIIKKLQRVQNTAARIVMRKNKRDSISAILKQLHWLPVQQRISFKVLCITHRCVQGTAPGYLSELVQLYLPSRSLRSTSQHLLHQPSAHLRTYGERSFSVVAPRLWNELPVEMRMCNSFETFKKQVKTHLFKLAFN